MTHVKSIRRESRRRRIRAKVRGSAARPRLAVHRSLTRISVQLVDDDSGRTLAAASTAEAKATVSKDGAAKLGSLIAKKAKDANISAVVFDRGGYKYHGRIQALADAAREAGLQF